MLFPLFFPPVWGDEVYSDVQERFNEGRPKAGNTGAFWEQQSTYLTLQPCHREQNTEERKGYKMQDRAVAGLHKGLGVKEP